MEAYPSLCHDGNKLSSPSEEATLLVSKPSPGSCGSTSQTTTGEERPSGKDFSKRKFPFLSKRKGAANSPQGQATSKSRLCMEATGGSPHRAVRRPAPQGEALRMDLDEETTPWKTGPSVLRKLLCLKASPSKPKKPPHGLEASRLHKASERCGPVVALSRPAQPQGESPLRWKPRVGTQSPAKASSTAEPEKVKPAERPGGSWVIKSWRTFRTRMTRSGAKELPVLPENECNQGAMEEQDPKTSPSTVTNNPFRDPQKNVIAIEGKGPLSAFQANADNCHGARDVEGSHGATQPRSEIHGRVGSSSEPIIEPGTDKTKGLLSKECGNQDYNPVVENIHDLDGLQTRICDLPGRSRLEAEDKGFQEEEEGYWVEVAGRENQEDLAELAENPGGQGMVMAVSDWGWLNSEMLGGPVTGSGEQKVEEQTDMSTGSKPVSHKIEGENAIMVDINTETKHSSEREAGLTPDNSSGTFPLPLSEKAKGNVATLRPCDICGVYPLEESGTPFPGCSLEVDLTAPLDACPTFSPTGSEQRVHEGAPGSSTPEPSQIVSTDGLGATGPGEKRLIYMAAVGIVEAAINVATEQLARREEQEEAKRWGPVDASPWGFNSVASGGSLQLDGWDKSQPCFPAVFPNHSQ